MVSAFFPARNGSRHAFLPLIERRVVPLQGKDPRNAPCWVFEFGIRARELGDVPHRLMTPEHSGETRTSLPE
jgi:hypothetical protein